MESTICIILVEPQGPLNIGSVCRAMLNFGLKELRIVNPTCNHLCDDARRMAVKATTILESSIIYETLETALADCHFAMGTTRRFGKYRENFLHPDQAARHILPLMQSGKIAMVFGREDHGLSTEELDLCQRLITIPTQKAMPSMNLAQSVSVCLYEMNKVFTENTVKKMPAKKLVSGEKLEAMFQHMRQTLVDVEYLDPQNPDHILRSFRQIFGRTQLNDREVQILQGLWSRIDWVESERKKLAGQI